MRCRRVYKWPTSLGKCLHGVSSPCWQSVVPIWDSMWESHFHVVFETTIIQIILNSRPEKWSLWCNLIESKLLETSALFLAPVAAKRQPVCPHYSGPKFDSYLVTILFIYHIWLQVEWGCVLLIWWQRRKKNTLGGWLQTHFLWTLNFSLPNRKTKKNKIK